MEIIVLIKLRIDKLTCRLMLVHTASVAAHGAAAALGRLGALGGGSAAGLRGGAFRRFGATSARHGTFTCGGH